MRIQWGKHFEKDQWLLYKEWFSVEVILDASLVVQLVKEYACYAGDPSWVPGSGRSPGEGRGYPLQYSWASLMAQTVKNPPAVLETWAWSLGWEDPLEGMVTHFSILAWRIPRTEESGGLQSMGSQRVGYSWATKPILDARIQETYG